MNVIVLTTGLSGSSLITGFIAKNGFWNGNETVVKNNSTGQYDTYENNALVELNDSLIEQAGFDFTQTSWYEPDARGVFDAARGKIDASRFQDFLDDCNQNAPWIWKDPKLWFTIGYWQHLIDPDTTRFITIRRNSLNLWVSQTSKRIIYDYGYLKRSEQAALDALHGWLDAKGFSYLELEFEQLVASPESQIPILDEFLETDLSREQFDEIYSKPDAFDNLKRHLLAWPIYFKNYASRIR